MCQNKTGQILLAWNDDCIFACFENGKWERVKGAPPNPDKNGRNRKNRKKIDEIEENRKKEKVNGALPNPTKDPTKEWCSCKIKLPNGKATGFPDGKKSKKDYLRCENMCQNKTGQILLAWNDDCIFACFENGKWERVKGAPPNPDKNGRNRKNRKKIDEIEENGKKEKVKGAPPNPTEDPTKEKVKGAPPNPTEDPTEMRCRCRIKLPNGKGTGFNDGSKKDFWRCENMCRDKTGQSLVSNDACIMECLYKGKWGKVEATPYTPDKNRRNRRNRT